MKQTGTQEQEKIMGQNIEYGWFAIAHSDELSHKKPLSIKRFGRRWVLWRDENGHAQILADRCPHRGAALSLGTIQSGSIVCPFHAFSYNGNGICTHMPVLPKGKIPKQIGNKLSRIPEHVWNTPRAMRACPGYVRNKPGPNAASLFRNTQCANRKTEQTVKH